MTLASFSPLEPFGEAVIDGPGVARRYLGDTDRTAAAFIQPPAWVPSRQRGHMYRTGDFVRYEPDGSLSFVGRQDNPVKVAGQRFDLSEAERALTESTIVQQVAALSHNKRLVAVISLPGSNVDNDEPFVRVADDVIHQHRGRIADETQERLPSCMTPSAWLFVKRLPLSQSNKLDRVAIAKWIST